MPEQTILYSQRWPEQTISGTLLEFFTFIVVRSVYDKRLRQVFVRLWIDSFAGCWNRRPQTSTAVPSNQPTQAASTPANSRDRAQTKETDEKNEPVYESATVLKSITRLVVVDVVAADQGGAVIDLKQNDFSILEDGKEQKIRVFNFQQPHANPPGIEAMAASKPPENVYSNAARFQRQQRAQICYC